MLKHGDVDFNYIPLSFGGDNEKFLEVTFNENLPAFAGYKAILIKDTIAGPGLDDEAYLANRGYAPDNKARINTWVVRFPRYVLAEFNTHRVFSRNSASSRARSVKTTIRDVMVDPVIPIFTKNQKGMSGIIMSGSEYEEAKRLWLESRDHAVRGALKLLLGEGYIDAGVSDREVAENYEKYIDQYYEEYTAEGNDKMLSVHKQNFNRLLEPFMWQEVVMSSNTLVNFMELREGLAYDLEDGPNTAQPEIAAIAFLMNEAINVHTPHISNVHAPFISIEEQGNFNKATLEELIEIGMKSSASAAQVSYHDKATETKNTASVALGKRLLMLRHMSPFEHFAIARNIGGHFDGEEFANNPLSSNFGSEWVQLRPILESLEKVQRVRVYHPEQTTSRVEGDFTPESSDIVKKGAHYGFNWGRTPEAGEVSAL